MKNENGKNLIIIGLIAVVAILVVALVLSLTGVFDSENETTDGGNNIENNENNNVEDNSQNDDKKENNQENNQINNDDSLNSQINYKEYTKGQIINLKDGSKWLVLADSNKDNDVVKLMSVEQFVFTSDSSDSGEFCEEQTISTYCIKNVDYDTLLPEFFNNYATYKGSYIESLVNSFISLIPANLQEIDGYKIRLLSIKDIFEYDNNWEKEDGIYYYTGENLNSAFLKAWTMDNVENKCTGNCGNFYVVWPGNGNSIDEKLRFPNLRGGASGIANIKPVIYVHKSSL